MFRVSGLGRTGQKRCSRPTPLQGIKGAAGQNIYRTKYLQRCSRPTPLQSIKGAAGQNIYRAQKYLQGAKKVQQANTLTGDKRCSRTKYLQDKIFTKVQQANTLTEHKRCSRTKYLQGTKLVFFFSCVFVFFRCSFTLPNWYPRQREGHT